MGIIILLLLIYYDNQFYFTDSLNDEALWLNIIV